MMKLGAIVGVLGDGDGNGDGNGNGEARRNCRVVNQWLIMRVVF